MEDVCDDLELAHFSTLIYTLYKYAPGNLPTVSLYLDLLYLDLLFAQLAEFLIVTGYYGLPRMS